MAELFKSCQACLKAWIPKEDIVFYPAFLDQSGSDRVFLTAFNLCWFGGQRSTSRLSYANGIIRAEFDVTTSALVIWMNKNLVFQMSFNGAVVFCYDDMIPSWREYLAQLVAKLPKELPPPTLEFRPPVPDARLRGGPDEDVIPLVPENR